MYPWLDYGGRLSPLKLLVFLSLFLPGIWVAAALALGMLGARPLNEAIHQIGLWTIRFLFISLAITPARQIFQWSRLLLVRRMIGVAAFTYGAIHLTLYMTDQAFDLAKIATEIALRIYLTIGFVALLGMAALAATSTDSMVRRLGGPRWQRLHQLIYGIATLAVIHFFMQSKAEIWEPTVMAGFLLWLLGYRVLAKRLAIRGRLPLIWVGLLGIGAGLATALGEALYFWLALGVDPARVLAVNLTLMTGVRPACVVLAAGLAVTAAGLLRMVVSPPPKGRLKTA